MERIGLYDPSSLSVNAGIMSIKFINALDVSDSEIIEIRSPQEASDMIDLLRRQENPVDCPLHVLGRKPARLSGVMMKSATAADEALIMTSGEGRGGNNIHSVKMLFDVAEGDLPKEGIAIVKGYFENETLMAHSIIVQSAPVSASPENIGASM